MKIDPVAKLNEQQEAIDDLKAHRRHVSDEAYEYLELCKMAVETMQLRAEVERLRAENERLRKACQYAYDYTKGQGDQIRLAYHLRKAIQG